MFKWGPPVGSYLFQCLSGLSWNINMGFKNLSFDVINLKTIKRILLTIVYLLVPVQDLKRRYSWSMFKFAKYSLVSDCCYVAWGVFPKHGNFFISRLLANRWFRTALRFINFPKGKFSSIDLIMSLWKYTAIRCDQTDACIDVSFGEVIRSTS